MKYELIERSCDLCGHSDSDLVHKKEAWTDGLKVMAGEEIVHDTDVMCKDCGLIYKSPMMTPRTLKQFYMSDEYIKTYKTENVTHISRNNAVQETVNSVYRMDWFDSIDFDLSGMKVLDVGASTGIFMHAMETMGAVVSGIEAGERNCKISHNIFGYSLINKVIEELPMDNRYDLITLCDVLEHVHSPKVLLGRLHKYLNPGGKILIEVSDAWYPYPGSAVGGFLSCAHTYTFTPITIRAYLSMMGYRVIALDHDGHNKCMLVLAELGASNAPTVGDSYETLMEFYGRYDKFFNAVGKNLVYEEHPDFSNVVGCLLAMRAIDANNPKRAVELTESMVFDQIEDTSTGAAMIYTVRGIANKLLGDIASAEHCFKTAMNLSPRMGNYNYVKELILSGVLSEQSMANLPYYIAKRGIADL